MNVSGSGLLLWVAFPYICLAVFVVGHVWRYRHDQFGWTTHTSQLLEHRWLRWGSPLFHLGAFMVIAGHVVGLAVPASWTEAAGISEHAYHTTAVWAGSVAGVAMVTGLGMLCARRLLTRRIRLGTDRSDKILFPLLSATVLLGIAATAAHNVFGDGYDYRTTVSLWFRGVFTLQPEPEAITGAPPLFQLHALTACMPSPPACSSPPGRSPVSSMCGACRSAIWSARTSSTGAEAPCRPAPPRPAQGAVRSYRRAEPTRLTASDRS